MAVDEGYVEPETTEVLVKYLRQPYPDTLRYAHAGDAGADLTASEDVMLRPFERALVPTGIAIALPAGIPNASRLSFNFGSFCARTCRR